MLGKRIKQKRLEKNLTQEELGNIIGVSKVSVCNWEKDIKKPSSENLILLSENLNTSIDYLIGNDYYVISDSDDEYAIRMANSEVELIEELRNHLKLYEMLLDDSKRTIDLIERKIL